MKIKVLQRHINAGEPGMGEHCPVAIAIKEQSKHKFVNVKGLEMYLGAWRAPSPDKVVQFVERFDNGESVKPFYFELPELL